MTEEDKKAFQLFPYLLLSSNIPISSLNTVSGWHNVTISDVSIAKLANSLISFLEEGIEIKW